MRLNFSSNGLIGWTVAICSVFTIAGCEQSGLPLVPVSGQLTYAGENWPKAGYVTFTPVSVAEGMPRRSGTGQFREDGKFEVTSFKPGDGLVPGTYAVAVSCWLGDPSGGDPSSFERLNAVPKDFRPAEVIVDPTADSVLVEFDVPKKK